MNVSVGSDERLVVMLEARISEFERRMRQAEQRGTRTYQQLRRQSRSATGQMEADMVRSSTAINRALAVTAARIGAFGAAFASLRGVQSYNRLADAATAMANSLRVAGLEGAELSRVYERLFGSAQRNSTPINSLVDLYSKMSLAQNELGASTEDLLTFTDNIAVALKVAGTDATTASGSLLQLSQALGGGIVRAEEFNSILEGTPTIAQAVARGLKEAGGSVAELRKLVVGGEVSSQAFFRAFEAGSAELQRQAGNSQTTVGQAMTRIGNSLVTAVGKFDQASGASAGLAGMISDLASGIDSFDADGFISEIRDIAEAFSDAEDAVSGWLRRLADAQTFRGLNELLGVTEGGEIINPDMREAEQKIDLLEGEIGDLQAQIQNNTELGFDNTEAIARLREVRAELAAVRAEAANLPRHVAGLKPDGSVTYNMSDTGTGVTAYTAPPKPSTPVSTQDYPAGGTGGTAPAGKSGGGRSGGGGRAKPDDYAREVQAIQERTQALQIEAAQLVLVASGEQDLGEAMDYARKKAELLHAAQQAGKQITPELEAEIDGLAGAYVQAGRSAEDAADKLDAIADHGEAGRDAMSDLFGSIIDGSMSARDAVAALLVEIAKTQMLRGIMGMPGIGGIAQGLGGLLVPGFAKGGMHSGGLRMVGENGPELEATGPSRIWSSEQTAKILAGGGGADGSSSSQNPGHQVVDVNVSVGIQQDGSMQAFVDKRVRNGVEKGIAVYDKALPAKVLDVQRNPRRRY